MEGIIAAEDEKRIRTGLKMVRVLLGCILFTVLIIAALPHLGVINLKVGSLNSKEHLKKIFYVLALFLAAAGFIFKKILSKSVKKENIKEQITTCIQSLFISQLVSFIIFEAIALLGFINFFISGNKETTLIFSTLSVICMMLSWPKIDSLKKKIE